MWFKKKHNYKLLGYNFFIKTNYPIKGKQLKY